MRFEFIGVLTTPKEVLRIDTYDAGVSNRLSMFIQKDKICSAYTEISSFKGKKQFDIKVKMKLNKDADKTEIVIPFKDRAKPESLAIVPDYYKRVLDLGTDEELKKEINYLEYKIRNAKWNNEVTDETEKQVKELTEKSLTKKEFLTDGDFLTAINESLEELKNKRVRVTGKLKFEVNKKNGKTYRKFIPSSIEYADADSVNKLELKVDYFFGEDSVSDDRFDDFKLVDIAGYVEDWDKLSKGNKLFPLPLVIDANKLDMANEKHVAYLDLFKSQLTSDDGISKLPITISYYRGGEQLDFTEDMLTDSQASMIAAGLATMDTYRPKKGVIGNNVEYFKVVNFDLKGEYSNGAIKQFDEDMLDTRLFIFNEEVVISKKTEKVTAKKQTVATDMDIENLFN